MTDRTTLMMTDDRSISVAVHPRARLTVLKAALFHCCLPANETVTNTQTEHPYYTNSQKSLSATLAG